ncbi:GUC2F-like protein [Mya arenaria]|uniref:Guanylate cyclase n=1 Tax=Mya arenaria TaxID=6604 RepID=A0ABY7FYS3_MYAAR|nr:GUC2F-like protein [Mya arenaria]
MFDFGLYDLYADTMETKKLQEITQLPEGGWKLVGKAEVRWPNGQVLSPDGCFLLATDMSKGQHKVLLSSEDLVFLRKRDVQKGSKGDLVHVKELKTKNFEIKSKVLHVIKTLRDIRHENDVLNNHDIKLDWDFKVSLLTDLIRGVRYIYNSSIHWHGNLKCRNCLIDSRWVLKVSDFGVPVLFGAAKLNPEFTDSDLLWMAPEHLRNAVPPLHGSEKGDVYSISIIMQCVILRADPYCTSGLSPHEIINKLKHPPPLLRPSVSHGAAPPQYIQLMKMCWTENPEMRPSLEEIYQQYKLFTGGKKMNIVDTMFRMLEKYSTDLEELVKERTLQLEEEKKKTDVLLYRMLPPTVADSLKVGRTIAAEHFTASASPQYQPTARQCKWLPFSMTSIQCLMQQSTPMMCTSGLPLRNGNRHAGEISNMALDLLSECGHFTIKHMHEVPLRVRIGLHTGPCVAGVVGLTMPRYCLFGDTVNTASRMESTGAAYRIHMSEATKTILEDLGGYYFQCRGEVELKGKGMAKTYWLITKDGFTKELPSPPPIARLSLEEFQVKTLKRTDTSQSLTLGQSSSDMASPGEISKHVQYENAKVLAVQPMKHHKTSGEYKVDLTKGEECTGNRQTKSRTDSIIKKYTKSNCDLKPDDVIATNSELNKPPERPLSPIVKVQNTNYAEGKGSFVTLKLKTRSRIIIPMDA